MLRKLTKSRWRRLGQSVTETALMSAAACAMGLLLNQLVTRNDAWRPNLSPSVVEYMFSSIEQVVGGPGP